MLAIWIFKMIVLYILISDKLNAKLLNFLLFLNEILSLYKIASMND